MCSLFILTTTKQFEGICYKFTDLQSIPHSLHPQLSELLRDTNSLGTLNISGNYHKQLQAYVSELLSSVSL